jgi:hypothetical protein
MKTVIEMAREAGLVGGPVYARGLERFAELVRADEREACAKVCEEVGEESDSFTRDILRSTAAAIRARGQA